jgi:hypothetical protein
MSPYTSNASDSPTVLNIHCDANYSTWYPAKADPPSIDEIQSQTIVRVELHPVNANPIKPIAGPIVQMAVQTFRTTFVDAFSLLMNQSANHPDGIETSHMQMYCRAERSPF